MAYKINDKCTSCAKCVNSCPAEAIKSGDNKYEIDEDLCISCGACFNECEHDAIEEDE